MRKPGAAPRKSITSTFSDVAAMRKSSSTPAGKGDKHRKAESWTGALLISQEPWAAGLNMPGASPAERNLLYSKMYELPNFPQQA